MEMKKHKIITNDKEFYQKLNLLHFSNEVIFPNKKNNQLKRIINNVNKKGNILKMEKLSNFIVVKKNNPFNFNVYLKK